MKRLILIPSLILLMSPLMAQAQDRQLSLDAQIDLLEVRALNALNDENWQLFLENIAELDELNVDLGLDVEFFVARAHFELGQFERSHKFLTGFLEAIGRDHPNYVEALSLYDELSERSAEEDHLYSRAVNGNNLSAAQQYLREYPQGRYRAEVLRASDELAYRNALSENTVSAFDDYLNNYPDGKFASEARNRKNKVDEVFVVVAEMPEPIGGMASIANQIEYPEIARRAGIQGRVFVQFVVDQSGRVSEAEILRGIGNDEMNEEALRVIRNTRFTPGKLEDGRPVRVQRTMPVTFRLN
jgi:TonB family protein